MNPIDHLSKKQKEMLVKLVEDQEIEHSTQNRFVLEKLTELDLAFRNRKTERVKIVSKLRKHSEKLISKIFYTASPTGHRLVDAILEQPTTPEPEVKPRRKPKKSKATPLEATATPAHDLRVVERTRIKGTSIGKVKDEAGKRSFAKFKAMKQQTSL